MPRDYSKYINRPGYQTPPGFDLSRYPRQSATADVAIFAFFEKKLHVLLVRRKNMPFQGYWAIPGGFVEMEEDLPEAAGRELREETGLKNLRLHEFGAFGHPRRDPRTRTITVGYLALARKEQVRPAAGSDAGEVGWFPARRPPEPAFDHELVLAAALARLAELCVLTPALFELLPESFSAGELASACAEIFGRKFSPASLLRKMKAAKIIRSAGKNCFRSAPANFSAGCLGFLFAKKKQIC